MSSCGGASACGDGLLASCTAGSAADNALMRPTLHSDGRGASLGSDDIAGAAALYAPVSGGGVSEQPVTPDDGDALGRCVPPGLGGEDVEDRRRLRRHDPVRLQVPHLEVLVEERGAVALRDEARHRAPDSVLGFGAHAPIIRHHHAPSPTFAPARAGHRSARSLACGSHRPPRLTVARGVRPSRAR